MPPHLQCKNISLEEIDFSDKSFSLDPFPESPLQDENFVNSITRNGILHPPIVREHSSKFQIVTGRKRLHIAHDKLHLKSCNMLVLPDDTPGQQCLAVALEDTLVRGQITPVEQAIFLQKSMQWLTKEKVVEEFMPLMGISPYKHDIKDFMKLLQLEEVFIWALHDSSLDLSVAFNLINLQPKDRKRILEIITLLKLSIGNQRKLTQATFELAKRFNSTVSAILAEPEVNEILDHPEANSPQKSANLMEWLTRKRFPRLSEAEKNFRKLTANLGLPKGVKVAHVPCFEKDNLTLTINLGNQRELEEKWPLIKKALTHQ